MTVTDVKPRVSTALLILAWCALMFMLLSPWFGLLSIVLMVAAVWKIDREYKAAKRENAQAERIRRSIQREGL